MMIERTFYIDGIPASSRRIRRTAAPKLGRKLSLLLVEAAAFTAPFVGTAMAQPSIGPETVTWSASAPAEAVKPGGRLKITLHGAVQRGWHVYGLKQLPEGPNPMRVTVDASDVAAAEGSPSGSPATKFQDPSFNLQTEFYDHDFTVTAPVRIGPHAAPGARTIPISVSFQTCNGGICQPPRTVHLSATVTVRANG